jgi:predicted nucleotidyltransferase
MVRLLADRIEKSLSKEVKAVLLVGSLTTGSYVPGPGSDIDQITIVRHGPPESTIDRVVEYLAEIEQETGYGIPFARTVYHLRDLQRPFATDFELTPENKKYLEVPVELLRIHESGKRIWGPLNLIAELPVPTREEVVAFDRLSRRASKTSTVTKRMRDLPPRISAQVMLTNAFRHYYYATGKSCSNKLRIYDLMRSEFPDYRYLVGLELAARMKRNMASTSPVLTEREAGILVAQAEALIRWKDDHEVDEVPLGTAVADSE